MSEPPAHGTVRARGVEVFLEGLRPTLVADLRIEVIGARPGATYDVGPAFAATAAGGDGGGPPDFVYYIFISMGVFFNIFAVNMVLQYKKVGKWADYLYGERMYVILSLVAKSALAWQVFAGTLRPE